MIDISVVTGTYNRLPYLQRFVASVRRSILPCLSYEIILVDGGSTDGTQPWAKAQPKVRLIEHGELKGAIKAFNDGFVAARGQYVIAGNDDVEFVGRSISRAWVHLQDKEEVGQACFYQKRGNAQRWHIELMPGVVEGRQTSIPYGQVAMVPNWLGEKVGWWGDLGARTYGGDNYLSARIWEEGFRVEGVPGAGIVDSMASDELRDINRGDPKEMARRGEVHPDSAIFYRRWPKGPTVASEPSEISPVVTFSRHLHVPIIDGAYPVSSQQKRGLTDALGQTGKVVEYDYLARVRQVGSPQMRDELKALLRDWRPDIAIFQIHSCEVLGPASIELMRAASPSTIFVNWNGDYRPGHIETPGGMALAQKMDVQCVANASEFWRYVQRGVAAAYWQIGVELDGVGYEPNGETPHHPVLFLANCYTDARKQLGLHLKSRWNAGVYGFAWPDGVASGFTLYDFRAGCRLLRAAQVAVGDQQWPDEAGYVSNRLFQTLAAGGAVLLQQRFAGMEEWLGLEDGVHLLTWNNLAELDRRIEWVLANEREAKRVAKAGQAFMLQHHTFEARVKELEGIIADRRFG